MRQSRAVTRLTAGTAVATLALLLCPAGASGQVCSLPEPLASLAPDTVPAPVPYATIRDQGVPFAEVDLGIGHLRPTDETWQWDWLSKIVLPLSRTSGAEPFAWIARGWAIDVETGIVEPFRVAGMVETGYEEPTFIVLNRTSADWIEIRVSPPGTTETGTAWIPACALQGEPVDLAVEPWEDRLTSDEISPLYFRTRVPHVLREAPGFDGTRLGVIAGNYHLEPQEIVGDWMRVIVKQPSDYCVLESRSVARTGWVKWRSDEIGPWVWYYSRGC